MLVMIIEALLVFLLTLSAVTWHASNRHFINEIERRSHEERTN